MADARSHDPVQLPPGPGAPPAGDEMMELRRLLLGMDPAQLKRLRGCLDDPARAAAEISRVLPDAIRLRSGRDDRIAAALSAERGEPVKLPL